MVKCVVRRKMFHFILMLLPLSLLANQQRTPNISHITQEQITDIGGTLKLECSVQYAEEYLVSWIKTLNDRSHSVFLTSGISLVMKDSRLTIRHNRDHDRPSSNYTLQINDVQQTDAGIYQCRVVMSRTNKISAEVVVSVRVPPVIVDNSTQTLIVSEGKSTQMECYASGYPQPTISWRSKNNAILPTGGMEYTGSVLKFDAVRKEDRGTYYCVADNGVSDGVHHNIYLEVEFAPVITVQNPRLGQAMEYDMVFGCHIEAYSSPDVFWLRDEIRLFNNQHYSISHFATADEVTDTTIRMITIVKRQYGDYVCKAVNKMGQAEATVHLFETELPVCIPDCSPYCGDAPAQNSTISCNVTSNVTVVND